MNDTARRAAALPIAVLLAAIPSASLLGQDAFPVTTTDGLERVPSERVDAVYWRAGATLEPYRRVALLDCTVTFRKNWENEQSQRRRYYTADAEDMQRMRDLLAEEFRAVFTRELEAGGYDVVDATGNDVLVLRPAIVDLDVAAPPLDVPGMVVNYVTSTGEMTLNLELVDSVTSSVIGRAIDRQEGSEVGGGVLISDTVKNREEANRILEGWAGTLRAALDDRWSGAR